MKNTLLLLFSVFFFSTYTTAQSWHNLGVGSNGLNGMGFEGIKSIGADKHGNIYVSGGFWNQKIDSFAYDSANIYKWDGTTWTRLGQLNGLGEVTFCIDSSDNVYAVGDLNDSGNAYVAKWDGTSWSELGGINAFHSHSTIGPIYIGNDYNLYVAYKYIDTVAGSYSGIAKWDGTSWVKLGTGTGLNANGQILSICMDPSGNMYAAGDFTDAPTPDTGNIYVAKWDGTSWSELGTGIVPTNSLNTRIIFTILSDTAGNIYASGYFTNSSNKYYVAKWNGSAWSELGTGINALNANGPIMQMTWDRSGNLYAGGYFTDTTRLVVQHTQGNVLVHPCYVAKWNGTTWTELGNGAGVLNANGAITALCSDSSDNVFAAGQFTDTSITFTILDTSSLSPLAVDTIYRNHAYIAAKYSNGTLSTGSLTVGPVYRIYPNPVNNLVHISTTNKVAPNTQYTLYNIAGRMQRSGYLEALTTIIDIGDLPPGPYFLTIGNTKKTYQIMKQ